MTMKPKKIEVCCGGDCMVEGAYAVVSALEERYRDGSTEITACGCVDRCEKAVNVIVDETGIFSYSTPENIIEKIEQGSGEPYHKFTPGQLDLNDDFLGDL